MLSTFASGPGLAPKFPWHSLDVNPAIRGVVRLTKVEFAHFGTKCGRGSIAITTNPGFADVFHPVYTQGISLFNVDRDKLIYIRPPDLSWVNPADCVDMDCDGPKHALIKDLDGSLTGVSGGTVISKAEFEWNGDPRRGLGIWLIIGKVYESSLFHNIVPYGGRTRAAYWRKLNSAYLGYFLVHTKVVKSEFGFNVDSVLRLAYCC